MGEVFLQTLTVGFNCSFTLDKPGYLRRKGELVLCSCFLPALFHPRTWRTICCVPNVFTGNYLVLFYQLKLGISLRKYTH
jgi:hypothetical protein